MREKLQKLGTEGCFYISQILKFIKNLEATTAII